MFPSRTVKVVEELSDVELDWESESIALLGSKMVEIQTDPPESVTMNNFCIYCSIKPDMSLHTDQ